MKKRNNIYVKYLKYVIKHKWYVFIECCLLWAPIRGILHDWSKFRPSEFFPYAKYFYGKYEGDEKVKVNENFNKAWLHHIHRNKHHWQYWILREDDGDTKHIPIPRKHLKEMLADWHGAGKAINGKKDTVNWYNKNRHKIEMHYESERWIMNAM